MIVSAAAESSFSVARYMDTFPQDEKELKIQFLDNITHRCSQAFKLLVNKCYEDLVCNLRGSVLLIPNVDSFIETIFDLDLDLDCIMYLRVVQCLNPSLFDTLESTLVKQHDLTKHKIHYRQVELTQARQVFTLAFLSKSSAKNKRCQADCDPPVKAAPKIKFGSDSCRPVGFGCGK